MNEDCRTEYTITAVSADKTMGYVAGGGIAMDGDEIIIRAIANPGYRFQRWQDGNTDSVRTVTVTGNATYTAYFSETVGIEEVADGLRPGVRVYPNPAHRSVTIEGVEPGEGVTLVDINGRTVSTLCASGSELSLDVSRLSPGTYFVQVAGLAAQRIVVVR